MIDVHQKNQTIATLTAVQPPGRFGSLEIKNDKITKFIEKPSDESGWVNGGYFVFEKDIFDHIYDDSTILEKKPLETLAESDQLSVYKHKGFWHPMDTLRDKNYLEKLWSSKNAPWKTW